MSVLRIFIAIDISPSIQLAIQQQAGFLRNTIGDQSIRWVAVQNMHLTLKFLGDVSFSNVKNLEEVLCTEADAHAAFDITIRGFGSFPNMKRPRVLYIGIQAPAELESLQRGIDIATARLGYESESRPFSPHLTMGRVKETVTAEDLQRIRRALDEVKIDSLGTARVDSIHLYKSELKPGGSVYSKLYSAPLPTVIARSGTTK